MITDTTTFVSAWADRKDEGHDLVSTSFIGAAPNSSVIDHVLRAMIMKPPKEITPLAVDLARSSPGAKESRPVRPVPPSSEALSPPTYPTTRFC